MKHSFFNKISLLLASTSLIVAGLSFNNKAQAVVAEDDPLYELVYVNDCPNISHSYYATYFDVEVNDIGWKAPGKQNNDNGWYIGGKDLSEVDRYLYTKDAIFEDITKVEIAVGNASNIVVHSLQFDVYSTADLATVGGNGDVDHQNVTFVENSTMAICNTNDEILWLDCFYRITFNVSVANKSDNKYVVLESISFYSASTLGKLKNDLDCVDSYFGLGYSYEKDYTYADGQVDEIDIDTVGESGNLSQHSLSSGATFVGHAGIKDKQAMILNQSTPHSGIVTTHSGGLVSKIAVEFYSGNDETYYLGVYGKNEPYNSADDLFGTNAQKGTLLGTIPVTGPNYIELSIPASSYQYIGIRSNKNTIYVKSIEISWVRLNFESSDFRLKVGVENKIANLNNAIEYNYGIEVSTTSKIKKYDFKANDPLVDEENDLMYQVIGLGDVLAEANRSRLTEQFTIRAYAYYDGNYIYSKLSKTHSLASLVKAYYEDNATKGIVSNIYNIFCKLGAIVEE